MVAAIAWLPFNFITMLIGQIMLSVFAEHQSDTNLLKQWTLHITLIISIIGFPALTFLILNGGTFITIVYGEIYSTVTIPFLIIFTTAFLRTCSMPMASIYLSIGLPDV